jgi:hypothetical protein
MGFVAINVALPSIGEALNISQGNLSWIVSSYTLSIITTTFAEGSERSWALGIWGAVAGAGGAAGVLLGGMLTECAGWEWVLLVNVPIGAFIV